MLDKYIDRLTKIGVKFNKVTGGLGATGWIIQLKEHEAMVITKDLTHNILMKILDSIAIHHLKAYEETAALRKQLEKEYYQRAIQGVNKQVQMQNQKGYTVNE